METSFDSSLCSITMSTNGCMPASACRTVYPEESPPLPVLRILGRQSLSKRTSDTFAGLFRFTSQPASSEAFASRVRSSSRNFPRISSSLARSSPTPRLSIEASTGTRGSSISL